MSVQKIVRAFATREKQKESTIRTRSIQRQGDEDGPLRQCKDHTKHRPKIVQAKDEANAAPLRQMCSATNGPNDWSFAI